MLKKFWSGFVFGAGFSVAVALAAWLMIQVSSMRSDGSPVYFGSAPALRESGQQEVIGTQYPLLHDLPIEQRVERASVIIVTKFESAADGRKKAVVAEILKQAPGTRFNYKVGDEYPAASYYPREGVDRGDGSVVFFEGVPAEMRYSSTYRDGRISGLGDIPLELFRDKCARARAG